MAFKSLIYKTYGKGGKKSTRQGIRKHGRRK